MAEHKFTIDLSGLELTESEKAQISAALQRAAINEIAALSIARGKGVPLDLKLRLSPKIEGLQAYIADEK